MAVLGKRKASAPDVSETDANDVFRRLFESQFLPLPASDAKADKKAKTVAADNQRHEENAEDEDDEEWGGLSGDDGNSDEDDEDDEDGQEDDDDIPVVEVVDHSSSQPQKPTSMSKRELKAFMSSRPPDQTAPSRDPSSTATPASASTTLPEDAPSLLAQDLELRRLLSESHLLAPALSNSLSGGSSSSSNADREPKAFAAGRTRQKATDLRIQALGSKLSIHKQEKMPMHMRKGIVAAAEARQTKRRREAKENGVILERETGKKKRQKNKGRDFGVDRPGVGRLKGAQLKISERDVKSIEGRRDVFGRR